MSDIRHEILYVRTGQTAEGFEAEGGVFGNDRALNLRVGGFDLGGGDVGYGALDLGN
jgi:hypothetical protein